MLYEQNAKAARTFCYRDTMEGGHGDQADLVNTGRGLVPGGWQQRPLHPAASDSAHTLQAETDSDPRVRHHMISHWRPPLLCYNEGHLSHHRKFCLLYGH